MGLWGADLLPLTSLGRLILMGGLWGLRDHIAFFVTEIWRDLNWVASGQRVHIGLCSSL